MNSNSQYVIELVFETAAVELGIPTETVKKVFTQGQVLFTSRKIGEGELETVMWPHFGKFRPKIAKIFKEQEMLAQREIRKVTKKPK